MKVKDTYHHGDLRQKIIQEALLWIEKKDIFSLSLRGVSRSLGVSHNAPYRHFSDRENLLLAIAEKGFRDLHQALQQTLVVNSPDNTQQQVEILSITYIKYALQNRAYYRVMFSTWVVGDVTSDRKKNQPKYSVLEQAKDEVFNIFVAAIKRQKIEISESEDPQTLANVYWSLVHGVSMLAIEGQQKETDIDSALKLANIALKTVSKGLRLSFKKSVG